MPGALMVTYRQREDPRTGEKEDVYLDAGKNPPDGALVHYFLKDTPEADIYADVFGDRRAARFGTFSSKNPEDRRATSRP